MVVVFPRREKPQEIPGVGVALPVGVKVAVTTVVQVEVGEAGVGVEVTRLVLVLVGEEVAVPVQVAVADPLVGVLVGWSGVKVFVANGVGVSVQVVVIIRVGVGVCVEVWVEVAEPVGRTVGLRVPVNVEVAVLPAGSGQVAQGPWEIRDLHPTNEQTANRRSMVPVI